MIFFGVTVYSNELTTIKFTTSFASSFPPLGVAAHDRCNSTGLDPD
jgi:hypothetical protein